MAWIGSDATIGTRHTLSSVLRLASEADIARVRESLRRARPLNRAAYVVGALKRARSERIAA